MSERFSTNLNARSGNGFPFVQAQIKSWLRHAHAIESKCFRIGRARGKEELSSLEQPKNQRLSFRCEPRSFKRHVRAWDLVVPGMGRIPNGIRQSCEESKSLLNLPDMVGLISGQKRKLGKYSSKLGNFHGRDAPFDVVPPFGIELVIAVELRPLPRFNGLSLVSRRSGDEDLPREN